MPAGLTAAAGMDADLPSAAPHTEYDEEGRGKALYSHT